jgi:uncharacterized RDD family membrane protein YckC
VTADAPAIPVAGGRADRWRLQDSYAGAFSRLVGYVIDVVIVSTSFAIGAVVTDYVVSAVLPVELNLDRTTLASAIALGVWSFAYFTYSLAATGRTIGKAIVGTRVLRADGSDLGPGRAAVRVLAMSLSFGLLCLGFALILLRKDRRALHDLIAGTCEIYWWRRT